jgi:hypothetical protein
VTGALTPDGKLGDPNFLKPGAYTHLSRETEMFAWVESKKTREEKQLGGSTKKVTTYTYNREWTRSPRSGEDFEHPEGHLNPPLEIPSERFYAPGATVGAYGFQPEEIELPSSRPLTLSAELLQPTAPKLSGGYLWKGRGTTAAPMLGDVRISYTALESGRLVTVYGQQSGKKILPYLHEGKDKLYRAVDGTHEQAVATLHGEHQTMTWILRLVGFLFMWFGLALVLGPINTVLDIIPFLGSTGRALTGIALFPVALVLAGVTILVAIVAHSPILLALVVLAVVGGIGYLVKTRAAKKRAAQGLAKAS